jgi:hypothetical protein
MNRCLHWVIIFPQTWLVFFISAHISLFNNMVVINLSECSFMFYNFCLILKIILIKFTLFFAWVVWFACTLYCDTRRHVIMAHSMLQIEKLASFGAAANRQEEQKENLSMEGTFLKSEWKFVLHSFSAFSFTAGSRILGQCPRLGCDSFSPPHPFQFVSHWSSCHWHCALWAANIIIK